MVRIASVLGAVVSGSWATFQVVGGGFPWTNLAYLLAYLVTGSLTLRDGFVRTTAHMMFWVAVLHVTTISMQGGPSIGTHHWLVTAAVGVYFVFGSDEAATRRVYALLALALFLAIEFGVLPPLLLQEAWAEVQTARVINLATAALGIVWLTREHVENQRRGEDALEEAHAASMELLHNMLPASIAQRLQDGESPIADRHEGSSVLFADLVGFTQLADRLPADQLVELLDRIFRDFDGIAEHHGIEKIKTIGDAYMAAAGAPDHRDDHAAALADVALEMLASISRIAAETGQPLAIRIGLHSGPVVGGVIGMKKFMYDLWGDTVNVASRMESHGEVGRIQLSQAVRDQLPERFDVESRGIVELKGKGPVATYFLVNRSAAGTMSPGF